MPDPTPVEQVAAGFEGFTGYLSHRRRYDDVRARSVLGPPDPAAAPPTLDDLLRGVLPQPVAAGVPA
ncbi:hypothetical protein GCM10025868_30270 [Angustibacter aerolatus]|uniref:Uncharacterized protein n=1 Tax=Angustibacter aerolatus TaxID=1162965 RepID=A0ABQ6JHS2_9ACTN|nr:hypothetical protein GCM10025868_30270 [Angustibacter aerolatus]